MNDDVLLILLLVAVAIAIVLLVVLLLRKPDAALALMRERLEDALRGEQRDLISRVGPSDLDHPTRGTR